MGFVDIHSHILPGLDDGAGSMDASMEMLRIAQEEGITRIFATPHYKSGRFHASVSTIQKQLDKVQREAELQDISVLLYAGNEIFYHSELESKLDSGELCTMNESQYVLIEFSPFDSFLYIRNAIEDIQGMGYFPILAHVERYECMVKDISCVEQLYAIGCLIQVNAGSVSGENGGVCKRFVRKILKRGLVHFIGTDAHNAFGRKPVMRKCASYLYKRLERSYADALLFGNAEKYLIQEKENAKP